MHLSFADLLFLFRFAVSMPPSTGELCRCRRARTEHVLSANETKISTHTQMKPFNWINRICKERASVDILKFFEIVQILPFGHQLGDGFCCRLRTQKSKRRLKAWILKRWNSIKFIIRTQPGLSKHTHISKDQFVPLSSIFCAWFAIQNASSTCLDHLCVCVCLFLIQFWIKSIKCTHKRLCTLTKAG